MAGSQDPNDYSAVLLNRGYLPLRTVILNLVRKFMADGRPSQANLLRIEWQRFERDMLSIAQRTAQRAQQAIRTEEETSRVRDDTGGGGGPRLESRLGESHAVPLVPGSVLVNDERALEEAGADWWWTNEEGYSGHIGREIRGVFMPGGVPPNQSDFRAHPLFRPMGIGGGGSGSARDVLAHIDRASNLVGEIRNPIPERRFVRRGFQDIRGQWHAEVRAAEARLVRTLQTLRVENQVRPGPRDRRRGR